MNLKFKHLLNFIGVSYSADAQLVLDRYSGLTATQSDAIAAYVDREVLAGRHSTMYETYIPALGATNGLIAFKTKTAINNGASFDSHGSVFDGTNYIDLNWIPSIDAPASLNDFYSFMYMYDNRSTTDFKRPFGSNDGANVNEIGIMQRATLGPMLATNQNTVSLVSGGRLGPIQDEESLSISRESAIIQKYYIDGVQNGANVTVSSSALSSKSVFLGAHNTNGTPTGHIDCTSPFIYFGPSIGVNKLDHHNSVVTLLTDLGVFF